MFSTFFNLYFIVLLFFQVLFLGVELATLLLRELKMHFNGRPCGRVELAF